MLPFLLRRLASGVVVLAAVLCLTFLLLFFSTDDVAANILGEQATPDQIVAKNAELGLDRPLLERLVDWWAAALTGDFGASWFNGQTVVAALATRLPVTLTLVLLSIVLIGVIATALGMTAAVRRGRADRAVQIGAAIGDALPSFLIGLLLVGLFVVTLPWFPAVSTIAPGAGIGPWVVSLTLPMTALLINGVAASAQQVRGAVLTQLSRDHVRTLRSRGLPEREILVRHVLRSAAPAGLTVLSLQFIGMLSAVVVMEQVFALPGVGTLAVQATTTGDLPLVMGVVAYTTVIVVVVNLLVDLANGWLNPKVRVA
ncbi:ABC transporter permease [Pseudonocardia sp. EC080610-09]|uniref:ABC transporter permease n=1 Tax=unclassified Pseudonocardia TaxID=2619320 RepID=UPI0006CB69D6|nr:MULTISPECIES: ABC transporter permease [unclassified Pseudonocardia]ALE73565.1 ABC transporter permease [Pseudonocardia sp. EC080625-04]ALL76904.1 ABC transporter permease [Pseudonocardia sp. EC080610-09]ALL83935.1 ABC transporter permease [Pseudonocardia sp. EC080619-01]